MLNSRALPSFFALICFSGFFPFFPSADLYPTYSEQLLFLRTSVRLPVVSSFVEKVLLADDCDELMRVSQHIHAYCSIVGRWSSSCAGL
jgi:hypothetical protein